MKVVLIANYSEQGGGISVQVRQLWKKLSDEGIGCDIVSTKGSLWERLRAICFLLFSGRKYEVFHVHACSGWGFFPAIVGITIGKCLRRRVVLTYHGGGAERFFRKRKRVVSFFISKTDANIVLSGFVGKVYDKYGFKYTIIPNIIEMDVCHFRQRHQIHPVFISIRSFTETYNLHCSLRAFKIVKGLFPDAKLFLVGDGPLKDTIQSFANDNGISGVSFVGHVSNYQIYDYLNQADIMISSSHFDNMPISFLEGFNAGLLVVATNVGGVPYMIKDGENGLLFEDDDYNEMADKMVYAVTHQQDSIRMICSAYNSLDNYKWESIKDKLISVYNV
ncbi:MAG: glycosyltransferase family 4 protein [Bacteroidales bacterium]|nr:glycosyltransferase family 4 protein [Bacteroidales bacterium]